MITKARIDLNSGTIELEGSEEFVTKYLDDFKGQVNGDSSSKKSKNRKSRASGSSTPKVKDDSPKETSGRAKSTKKSSAARIAPERFDIHAHGERVSLEDFMDAKKPGSANGCKIAAIGYYITEFLENESFTEGQIEYAYRMLKLKRPAHLHQIMINTKNKKDWYEPVQDGETNAWQMTRSGEIYVADELPLNADEH